MSTVQSCPRCMGAIQPSDKVCPRCGLLLKNLAAPLEDAVSSGGQIASDPLVSSLRPIAPVASPQPGRTDTGPLPAGRGTGPLVPPGSTGPLVSSPNTGPLPHTGPLRTGPLNSSLLADGAGRTAEAGRMRSVPRGALELLPQETVAFQLGALYLTTKRVTLLAPSVIRSAFIRDIDAVGTFTERASGWFLFAGLLLLALSGLGVYASVARSSQKLETAFPYLYYVDPIFVAALLTAAAVFMLVRYFFHVKRTLFVSVKGRPLITVSIADWNTRKLDGMDAFVNAFFQIKDFQTGELGERQLEGR